MIDPLLLVAMAFCFLVTCIMYVFAVIFGAWFLYDEKFTFKKVLLEFIQQEFHQKQYFKM